MDTINQSVIDKLRQRAEVGHKKYGVTMDRTDLTEEQWLQHAQCEAMDLTVYLEKLIQIGDAKSHLLHRFVGVGCLVRTLLEEITADCHPMAVGRELEALKELNELLDESKKFQPSVEQLKRWESQNR